MCGFAGITGLATSGQLSRFQRSLHHRGPDGRGEFSDGRIALAHDRLSIIDLAGGRQPMFNEDRTCTIVFNGEIYNYRELREQLKQRHVFATESDTEVILHLYEERGLDTPTYLKGDFAFCIWDARDQSCFLSRDPLGVKPLFYAITRSGELLFSSEIRTILDHPDADDTVDADALAEYMTCLYVAAPRTMLKNVHKLQPGESLLFKAGTTRTWRYWTIPELEPGRTSSIEVREKARELLKTAVRRRLIADVPVGAFLSGGLDSSLIVALASEFSPGLHTFSIGYADADFDELPFARTVSERYGTTHHEFVIEARAEDLIEDVIDAVDEPIADSSAIPTFLIARETRRHVKVALSGIGGDEMFFGYPRYLGAKLGEWIPGPMRGSVSRLTSMWSSQPSGIDTGGRIRRFGKGLEFDSNARYILWTTFLDRAARTGLLPGKNAEGVFENEMLGALRKGQGRLLDRIFRYDVGRYIAYDLLPLCDNMTMAHSVEARVPFCDVDLVSEMARTPAAVRFPGYRLKSILRDIGRDFLPPEILNRRKQGFMIPIGRWFRQDLRDYVDSHLRGSDLSDMVDRKGVLDLWNQHVSGKVNATHVLWAIILFSAWRRKTRERKTSIR